MNTANKLTVLRIIFVPFFVAALLCDMIPGNYIVALVLFLAAAITDSLDGKLARKQGTVTDFGKFLDPLADKILVMSSLICFVQMGWADAVMVIIILTREFLVTSLRLVAGASGIVIAANRWGKIKTVSQMIAIISVILALAICQTLGSGLGFVMGAHFLTQLLLWVSAALTLASGIVYLWQNRNILSDIS